MEKRTYISPHLDDAVLSCGGVIYQQTSRGDEVVVVTVCAGEPTTNLLSPFAQELHMRWGMDPSPVRFRREEDIQACAKLGAKVRHLPVPDAIYRLGKDGEPLYASEKAIFGTLHPTELELQTRIAGVVKETLTGTTPVYAPVGFGGHVDHRLTRGIVDRLGIDVMFYRDFPYAMRGEGVPAEMEIPMGEEFQVRLSDLEIRMWAEAVKEYKSQLSTFWIDFQVIENELRRAHDQMGGIPLVSSARSIQY